MNAIINTKERPTFAGENVDQVAQGGELRASRTPNCWCEPGRDNKCWQRGAATETVHHILKGGEDSIGALEAIQRVYFNIGSCSEQCWVNHLTDLRQLDPTQRNFGQTPFDIGQCRRDCPNFRAIEDRLARHPRVPDCRRKPMRPISSSLARNAKQAVNPKATYTSADLQRDLDKQFGANAVARGREVFATTARAAIRRSQKRRRTRSRIAISAPSAQTACAPTGWAPTRRRWRPKSAPFAAARCIRIT